MRMRCTVCVLVLVIVSAARLNAADQPSQEVTRVIDIRDLVTPIPDFIGGGLPQPHEAANVRSAEHVERMLLTSIQTGLAGPEASPKVEMKEGQLVATGTEAQLQALERLISQLRQQRSVQINVEARLLALTDKFLQSLPDDLRAKIAQASIAPQPLTEEDVARLMELVRKGVDGSSDITAPNLTLFNQQRAFVQVMTSESYVADFRRNQEGALEPVRDAVWSGIHLDVRAAARTDGTSASAQIAITLQRLLGFEEATVEGTERLKQVPKIERMEFDRLVSGLGTLVLDAQRVPVNAAGEGEAQPTLVVPLVRLRPIVPQPAGDPATPVPASR